MEHVDGAESVRFTDERVAEVKREGLRPPDRRDWKEPSEPQIANATKSRKERKHDDGYNTRH